MSTLWILGAPDAEMTAIKDLLRDCGQSFLYALGALPRAGEAGDLDALRVRPGQVAVAAGETYPTGDVVWYNLPGTHFSGWEIVAIEVAGPWGAPQIDHHDDAERASWGPERFLQASSLGQVVERLAQLGRIPATWARAGCVADGSPVGYLHQPEDAGGAWAVLVEDGLVAFLPTDLVLEAAADHCPAAAVAGLCPGVDPGVFAPFLAESKRRQYFPAMSAEDFARELATSRATLLAAPEVDGLPYVRDLRHLEPGTVPAQVQRLRS